MVHASQGAKNIGMPKDNAVEGNSSPYMYKGMTRPYRNIFIYSIA